MGSALDIDTGSNSSSSSNIPSTVANDHMRQRSDVLRMRPQELPVAGPEIIELPVLTYAGERKETVFVSVHTSDPPDVLGTFIDSERAQASLAPMSGEDGISNAPNVSAALKAQYRRRSRLHFVALCYAFFLAGWNDGTTGPLLPIIQHHYNIGFAIISLLFVTTTVGFLSGSILNVSLNDRFGFGKTALYSGALFQLAGYALISPAGPFPLMCVGFGLTGFGLALQNAQANGFVGSLKEGSRTKYNLLHAHYGLGALVAPLVATQFAESPHWSFHYLISAGISVTNVILLYFVFRGRNQDDVMADAGVVPEEPNPLRENKYRHILGLKEVHYLFVFALIYIGVEVSLGGWIVTFVQQKRGGGASAGYISSGFYAGLMLGRITLMWFSRKIGERNVMYLYALLAIQLDVTIWVVPSLTENAVAVAFIGLLLGPMYPILMNHCKAILPRWIFIGGIGYIAGVGQSGSAILPFITGSLASKFGIISLQPLIVSMMSTMIVFWALVPRVRRAE
ncbi:MFS general substrate transporter [Obba rivulosa]|uniref:MFS general substrate transporter n=1 Tax=Obba rivulosa TaxID=1052685 RepID=A0A8E2DHR1_9APHY|nr:MFS general substrate transporter [Obba rivulosa]